MKEVDHEAERKLILHAERGTTTNPSKRETANVTRLVDERTLPYSLLVFRTTVEPQLRGGELYEYQ